MSSFDAFLRMEKPVDTDTTWGPAARQWIDTLSQVSAPERVYHVSPDFSDANLNNASATDRRHFDTIQAAITAGEAQAFDADGYTVFVWPGKYEERLTITRSVAVIGVGGGGDGFYVGGNRAKLRGDNAANAVIDVAPIDSTLTRVLFENLEIDNRYDVTNAVQITAEPYLLRAHSTASNDTQNSLTFNRCTVRMQTWGNDNDWLYGIWLEGRYTLVMQDCQIQRHGFSGGNNNGGVQKLVFVEGVNDSTKVPTLHIVRSYFAGVYLGSGTLRTFVLNKWANLKLSHSTIDQGVGAATEDLGTGTNAFFGILSGEDVTHQNVVGIGGLNHNI